MPAMVVKYTMPPSLNPTHPKTTDASIALAQP